MRPPQLPTSTVLVLALALALAACDSSSKSGGPTASAPGSSAASASLSASPAAASAAPAEGTLRLGAPIEASTTKVTLADVAKAPSSYVGKTFATTGTVTAVCQHMGCWMELKDDASEAHIKMAGHSFFVPKTASGRKARVLAKLVKTEEKKGACEDEGHEGHEGMSAAGAAGAGEKKKGCRAEAEAQLGRPLAKLELEAEGVELL